MKHLILILAIGLCGCRSFVPPNTVETKFHGIAKLAATGEPVRMFLIHGMSDHETNWSLTAYLQPIMDKQHWHVDIDGTRQEPVAVAGTDGLFAALLTRFTITDGSSPRILAYELTWSPLAEPFKTNRFTADSTISRPLINGMLRQVIDWNLADVVLYISKYDNDIMARSVSEALRMFYTGSLDAKEGMTAERSIDKSPVVFLSESLGSKMLFDAIEDRNSKEAVNKSALGDRKRFNDMLANNTHMFMMANQLALLDMPETNAVTPEPTADFLAKETQKSPSRHKSLNAYMKIRHGIVADRSMNSKNVEHTHLFMIAYNDSYDVLSFKVEPTDIPPDPDVTIDNFTPANAWNWFGILEWPATAHNGYGSNHDVINTVVNGYP